MGVTWYVGIPESGKSHQALDDFLDAKRATGYGGVIIDGARADNFERFEHARSVDDVIEAVWGYHLVVAYTPADPDEVHQLAMAALSARRSLWLVDEAADYIDASTGRRSPLTRLMRQHRHAKASLHLTTQHFSGDVSQIALSCAPRVLIFRNESESVLEALRRRYGYDPDFVRNIPQYKYIERETGFGAGKALTVKGNPVARVPGHEAEGPPDPGRGDRRG